MWRREIGQERGGKERVEKGIDRDTLAPLPTSHIA